MHVRQHQPSQRLPLDHRNCTITATNFASSPSATRRPSGVQKGRQRPLGTGPIMTPVLTGRSLHFYPQMGIARPQTLALALSLGRLSASSNLCPRHETFDYRNLFLPHPVLQCRYHVDPQRIHLCPRHCIQTDTLDFSGQVSAPSASTELFTQEAAAPAPAPAPATLSALHLH